MKVINKITPEQERKTAKKFEDWDIIVKEGHLDTGTPKQKAHAARLLKNDPTVYAYAFFKDRNGRPFKLYSYQDVIANDASNRILFAAANQIGKSIDLDIIACHFVLTNPGKTVLMTSKTEKQAMDLLREVKRLLNTSKVAYKTQIGDSDSKTELYIKHYDYYKEDGVMKCKELAQSRIIVSPATDAILGYPVDLALIDELAFYENGRHFYYQLLNPRTYTTKGKIIVFSNPNGQCYDKDTDVMTKRGWVNWKDVNEDTEFMIKDKKGCIAFSKPFRLIKEKYKGNLINFKNRQLDMMVTPNHNLWFKKQFYGKWRFETAESLLESKSNLIFDKGIDWIGKIDAKNMAIPEHKSRSNFFDQKHIPIDEWLEWFGYWLAEGSVTKNRCQVTITQNPGDSLNKMIESTSKICYYLKKNFVVIDHNINGKRIIINSVQLGTYLKSLNKGIPHLIKQLPKDRLKILVDAYDLGDGDEKHRMAIDYSRYPHLADDLQECCLKIGKNSNLFIDKKGTCATVTQNKATHTKFRAWDNFNEINLIPYDDYVYCATVPNHQLFVRRKGRPVWSGNSGIFWELWNDDSFSRYCFNFLDCPTNTKEEYDALKLKLTRAEFDSTVNAKFTSPAGGFIDELERKAMQVQKPNMIPPVLPEPVFIFYDFAKTSDRTVRVIGVPAGSGENIGVNVYEMYEYAQGVPYNVIIEDLTDLIKNIGSSNIFAVGWDNTGVGKGIQDFIEKVKMLGIETMPVEFSLQNKSKLYTTFKFLVEKNLRGEFGIKIPFMEECDKQLAQLRFKRTARGYLQVHHDSERDRDDFPDALAGLCTMIVNPPETPANLEVC